MSVEYEYKNHLYCRNQLYLVHEHELNQQTHNCLY